MRTKINSLKRTIQGSFKLSIALLICFSFLLTPSCQKDDFNQGLLGMAGMAPFSTLVNLSPTANLYFGPETFRSVFKQSLLEKRSLSKNFKYFNGNPTLKIKNGNSSNTKVNDLEIKIDGALIVTSSDIRRKVNVLTKPLSGLNELSTMEVQVQGPKGSFIELSIEDALKEDVITDLDGNYYNTVLIGDQWWMAENLKTTKFNDGTVIPLVTDNSIWDAYTNPAYCWYNNDEATYKPDYGALYNKYSAYSDKLCPTGWHVPSLTEWIVLRDYLGGEYSGAGGKMKETSTTHWQSPNEATNESGFRALPGGIRKFWPENATSFRDIRTGGHWWNSTFPSDIYNSSEWLYLQYNMTNIYIFSGSNNENAGMSIRCVKNN